MPLPARRSTRSVPTTKYRETNGAVARSANANMRLSAAPYPGPKLAIDAEWYTVRTRAARAATRPSRPAFDWWVCTTSADRARKSDTSRASVRGSPDASTERTSSGHSMTSCSAARDATTSGSDSPPTTTRCSAGTARSTS